MTTGATMRFEWEALMVMLRCLCMLIHIMLFQECKEGNGMIILPVLQVMV